MITIKDVELICAKGETEQDRKDIYDAAMRLINNSRYYNYITDLKYYRELTTINEQNSPK